MKGIFITFEGIEGCGKTTQARLLCKHLEDKGMKVLMTREPGGTAVSEAVREILLSNDFASMHPRTEVLLYLASRAQHIFEVIKPALEKGLTVISDRFEDSTFVYQCYVRKIDQKIVTSMNRFATDGISPHLTFVLDIDPVHGLQRAKSRNQKHQRKEDRMENETMEFHRRVREGYLRIAAQYPERTYVINSGREKDIVHKELADIADHRMGEF